MSPWKVVVVGVDASPESARAASAAWKIAEAAGIECRLVHVVPQLIAGVIAAGPPPTLQSLFLRDARARVEEALKDAVPAGLLERLEVMLGRPATDLVDLAADADLLVLGSKHHTALGRWFAGSTVHQVVRSTDTPTLVAGPSPEVPRRILAAVDLSSAAEQVLEQTRKLAELFRAQVAVLHVIEPVSLTFAPYGLTGLTGGDLLTDVAWLNASRETFDQAVWSQVDYPGAEKLEVTGPVTSVIRSELARWRADLLVVGSHGRGWMDRLLLGSTTHRLLSDLPASMLVVPVRTPVSLYGAATAEAAGHA
ncbi:MAG: universal stress protein [Gemmatimonadetes bacterium]|nr:universal stress protein [Gemmatimonadota bacterium]